MVVGPSRCGTVLVMAAVCVFCGSNSGRDPAYVSATEALGRPLAAIAEWIDTAADA